MYMKKFIITLVSLVILSSCTSPSGKSLRHSEENNLATEIPSLKNETVTTKVIRIGRYTQQGLKGGGYSETGTVLIFENGDIFKDKDERASFACALKEGDVVTYRRNSASGKIVLESFVVQND